MVHKIVEKGKGLELTDIPNNKGIHKYNSTSETLDYYDNQVEKMHEALDKSYRESQRRAEQIQLEDELEQEEQEEELFIEKMRQLEIERAEAEIEAIKESIERSKRPAPRPAPKVVEQKPSLRERVYNLGRRVAQIVGGVTGHPHVSAVATALPEADGVEPTKTTTKQPQYTERGELIYGSWT